MADQPEPNAEAPLPTPPPPSEPLLRPLRPRPAAVTQNLPGLTDLTKTQAILPRRHLPTDRPAATTSNLTALVDLAKQVQAMTGGGEAATADEPAARKVKKFQRTGTAQDERVVTQTLTHYAADAARPAAPAAPPPKAAVPAPTKDAVFSPVAFPRRPQAQTAAPPSAAKPKRRKPQDNVWVWAAVQAFGFGLIALGYGLARLLPASAAPAPAAKTEQTAAPGQGGERALDAASAALQAEQTGDDARARLLYEAGLIQKPPLPGASYRLALLAIRRGDSAGAEQALARSAQAGEEPAACAYLRARLAANKGDFEESVRQLQAAARAEPFDGRYLFYLGEALRRQGKNASAADNLTRALDRPGRAEDLQLYAFKRRLLQAAGTPDDAFSAELAAGLRQSPASGEWLLLAAAQDISQKRFKEAAGHLKSAAAALPPGRYASLMRDYFFLNFANPAPFLPAADLAETASAARKAAGTVDPVVASPELADPAIWFLPPPVPVE